MLNFCAFIQVYVFTTNHHLNASEQASSVAHDAAMYLHMDKILHSSWKELPC